MTIPDAKKILQLYRPRSNDDDDDRQIAEALKVARNDADLGNWLAQHNRFQIALREKFLEIPVPGDLKQKLLSQPKVIRPLPFWRDPLSLRLAASIVILIGLCFVGNALWKNSRVPDRFADYEARMVRSALREYHMDLVTNNLTQIRQWMSSHGAPADFSLPKGLTQLELAGGGVLRWRNHPVSMICFHRGDNEMLFLFVMNRSAVKDPPKEKAALEKVNRLSATSWSEGDITYFLAGPEEANFLQKYL
jgi:hypothetical protein